MEIMDYQIAGANEAVLLSNTSRRWYQLVLSWRQSRGFGTVRQLNLTIGSFVRNIELLTWARDNGYQNKHPHLCLMWAARFKLLSPKGKTAEYSLCRPQLT